MIGNILKSWTCVLAALICTVVYKGTVRRCVPYVTGRLQAFLTVNYYLNIVIKSKLYDFLAEIYKRWELVEYIHPRQFKISGRQHAYTGNLKLMSDDREILRTRLFIPAINWLRVLQRADGCWKSLPYCFFHNTDAFVSQRLNYAVKQDVTLSLACVRTPDVGHRHPC